LRQKKGEQSNLELKMKLTGNQLPNENRPSGHKKERTQQFSVNLIAISRYYPEVLRRNPR
jgi:hypothetical protein